MRGFRTTSRRWWRPVHEGDAYVTLHNGDEAYPAMLAAIDGAKSRINFETYVFSDGEIGERFIDALARAAQRGVSVRIVLDPIGSSLGRQEQRSTEGGRRQPLLVQRARLLQPRRVQLPDPPQDAGGRR